MVTQFLQQALSTHTFNDARGVATRIPPGSPCQLRSHRLASHRARFGSVRACRRLTCKLRYGLVGSFRHQTRRSACGREEPATCALSCCHSRSSETERQLLVIVIGASRPEGEVRAAKSAAAKPAVGLRRGHGRLAGRPFRHRLTNHAALRRPDMRSAFSCITCTTKRITACTGVESLNSR